MPWYILALLVSVPVIALSTWASRKGNLPLVLAMLAVALVFVGATHGWVPALSQREGSLDLSATFLLGWCIGLSGLTLARRRKPRP
ncbi:MAG TPA: hypothetical protein H9947_01725 [Candidatus Evtepia excrementipullorum]|nr:hypothetical protein [Candidatus Evtepia excrementipullorum]